MVLPKTQCTYALVIRSALRSQREAIARQIFTGLNTLLGRLKVGAPYGETRTACRPPPDVGARLTDEKFKHNVTIGYRVAVESPLQHPRPWYNLWLL